MRLVTAHDGQPLDDLRRALDRALSDGPALAVLPQSPLAWQQVVRDAVHPERDVPGPGLVVPTSGSTGPPTGVVLHRDAVRWAATAVTERLGGDGSWVLALPLTHVAGMMVVARAGTSAMPVVRPNDDWAAALRRLPSGRRYTALVPTQLRRMLRSQPQTLASFDAVLVGGARLDPGLRTTAERHGVRLVESYGMTETCGGCVHDGVPLSGVSVRLEPDGRVSLAGPMLAQAYRRAEADEVLAPDGWFTTNDLGQWHDGTLRVLGRVDDVVLTGGVSVSLPHVESLLAGHPDLADVAVVGVPDEEWGTAVVAVVVPATGARPSLADLRAYAAERAEPAYCPRGLVLTDRLPRPAPGKIDRALLGRLVRDR